MTGNLNSNTEGNRMNGLMTTDAMGMQSLQTIAETTTSAIAEQAKAAVQARYVMALQRPRSWDSVRLSILGACRRPRFAEKAIYKKPVGKNVIEGPSARFAEEALRAMGNVMPECYSVLEDSEKIIYRVSLTDLENNLTFTRDITIKKTVERRNVRQGQEVVHSRQNTKGQTVYIVKASDDEILNKVNAMVSKTQRNLTMMLLPSDIAEEAIETAYATQKNKSTNDPTAERKRLIDVFSAIGVSPKNLTDYLGHSLEQLIPSELDELRQIYSAISEGEAKWIDFVELKKPEDSDSPLSSTVITRQEAIKAALKKKGSDKDD